ncbi:MAG TPA: class I SAM-dependent methyltransferase [Myxococcaceae bacterium]|nr:class I SAM-dependent methyltransferase [Myxococcaceae bacterium]
MSFTPVESCWVCGARERRVMGTARFDLSAQHAEHPELAPYTGKTVALAECRRCGFGQPEALPSLPSYFEAMYDQSWSEEWIEGEFKATYKDLIFRRVLGELERRVPRGERRLLDIGAHVGRLMSLASRAGWAAEGIELNPRTSAFAAKATGLPVHRQDAATLAERGVRYGAVTLIDVLEHLPRPVGILKAARKLMAPGGWIAVKVPHGRMQMVKERWRSRIQRGYEGAVATNLVHVNQFGPRSLRAALEGAGFSDVEIEIGAPELPEGGRVENAVRLAVWRAGRLLPRRVGVASPLSLHLQAYAHAL